MRWDCFGDLVEFFFLLLPKGLGFIRRCFTAAESIGCLLYDLSV